MWNRRMELEIQLPIQDVFVHLNPFWAGSRPQVPEYGRVRQAQLLERMAWLNRELGTGPMSRAKASVADITAQCAFVMGRATGSKIPEHDQPVALVRSGDEPADRPRLTRLRPFRLRRNGRRDDFLLRLDQQGFARIRFMVRARARTPRRRFQRLAASAWRDNARRTARRSHRRRR